MADTKIEWTDKSWNPATGCSPISEGCANCYARRMAIRLGGRCGYPPRSADGKQHPFDVTLHPDKLDQPLKWRKPRRVFACSMGDLFHEDVPDEFIAQVFAVMWRCWPRHTFQVLTKRPARMLDLMTRMETGRCTQWGKHAGTPLSDIVWLKGRAWQRAMAKETRFCTKVCDWPLPNVWLGVTAENQARADERTRLLQQTPAAVRFVSVEPMLGPIYSMPLEGVDWVICGAETGLGARPMQPEWAYHLRDQCRNMGVPFFFKKWSKGLDGGDMPREFPR